MYCVDALTGQGLWNVTFWGLFPIIADGYALSLNYYDGQVYCFGKGPSETTLTASPKVSELGSSIIIEGKVTDQSVGAKDTPAVSDVSMANWMEYLYEQQPMPTNATGVTVSLDVIDANGNFRNIGSATTDLSGMFSFTWKPDIPGKYTVVATYAGSNSYASSYAETAFQVDQAPNVSPTILPETQAPMTDTYVIGMGIAIIIAIAVVGIAIVSVVRKK
jgi:hypothetical protein